MSPVTIRTEPRDRTTVVMIEGDIDEHADLSTLDSISGSVELNLAGVRRFNSMGVRDWIQALRGLSERGSLTCTNCSVAVVVQLNMISGFLCHATVRSFYAPMRCEGCDLHTNHLCLSDDVRAADAIEPPPCATCGAPMELDEPADAYIFFLREPTLVGS